MSVRGKGGNRGRFCDGMAVALLGCLVLWTTPANGAVQLLQNDSFQSGDQAAFQQGFVSGEMAAVTLGPLGSAFHVLNIQLLFGGDTSQQTVTLHVYQDNGTANPGTEIYSGDYQLTGSNENLVQIDVSGENIVVGSGVMFRVALEFHHDGVPSVARDADGIHSGRNWIFSQGWGDAASFLVQGDWIIRAEVDTIATQPDAGVLPDASQGDAGVSQDASEGQDGAQGSDAAPSQDGTTGQDGSSSSACDTSDQCSGGQVCYGGNCVSVCSSDGDCSAGSRCHHGLCKLTCTASSQCSGGQVCADEVCQAACVSNQDCRGGEVCKDSVCRTTCATDAECSSGESCQGNVCLPGQAAAGEDKGCGCSTGGGAGPGLLFLLVLFVLGVMVRPFAGRRN